MENGQYNASDFLDDICNAAVKYKARTTYFDTRISLELPKESYERFKTEMPVGAIGTLADFKHGAFNMSVTCKEDA